MVAVAYRISLRHCKMLDAQSHKHNDWWRQTPLGKIFAPIYT